MSGFKYSLLKALLRSRHHQSLIGDFLEIYQDTADQKGKWAAARWFWIQVFRLLPSYLEHRLIIGSAMFTSYFKVTCRNIRKNNIFSLINVLGLTLGITCALLIFSFVRYELSIDSFHKDPHTIYQVFAHPKWKKNTTTQVDLGPEIKKEIPGIIEFTRYHWPWGENFLTYKDITHAEGKIRFVDPSFFKVFHFPLLKGDPATALKDPNSIIVTPEIANKYFGYQDPIGKVLIFNHKHPLTITGVLKPLPVNSTITFDMLMPLKFNIRRNQKWYRDWSNLFVYTFIRVRPHTRPSQITPGIVRLLDRHKKRFNSFATLMPLKERYFQFYSDKTNVFAFTAIAIFILLIACFNFMNLSTARSATRSREIGMRKVAGATKKQIIAQFLGESIFIALLAALLAVMLYILLLPLLRTLTGKDIMLNTWFLISNTALLTLFTGVMAGIYPAFFLSRFNIVQVIKNRVGRGPKTSRLRRGTVVLQFVISILLIMGMLMVQRQSHFIRHHDIGYNKKNLVCIPMGGGSETYYQTFKNELLKDTRIRAVSGTGLEFPFFNWRQGGVTWEGRDQEESIQVSYNVVDYHFISTMEMEMVEGEDFTPGRSYQNAYIINQELADMMGNGSMIGRTLRQPGKVGRIVGVVRNFHFNSFQNTIEPLIMELMPKSVDNLLIRISDGDAAATLSFIKGTWKRIIPQYPFNYSFLEDDYQANLVGLNRTGYLASIFSLLAIIISCLGLFGLSSYTAVQKTREIGLRKVMGASVFSIIRYISREFIYLILLANIIVWPVAVYLLNQWLQRFAYHTDLGWGTFAAAAVLSLGISLLTIAYQTIKAARTNPINTLRYE